MKGFCLLLVTLFLAAGLGAQVLSCYDVQHTTDPSGDSPHVGQSVTVQGIVVAERYYTGNSANNYGFMLSDPVAGPFSGLFVYSNQYQPALGDLVQVTGPIVEYYGLTELSIPTGFEVLSSNNPIPAPVELTTGQLIASDAEQWEGVFARLSNVSITSAPTSNYQEFYVNDGSGICQIDDQCFPRGFFFPDIVVGQTWYRMQGVVDFSYEYYALNPRTLEDMIKEDSVASSSIRIPTLDGTLNTEISIPITTSMVKLEWGISGYSVTIKIDPTKLHFQDLDISNSLTEIKPDPYISTLGDTISFSFSKQDPFISADGDTLINLILKPLVYGESLVELVEFKYDNVNIPGLTGGRILTKIQKSIAYLNIGNPLNTKNIFNPSMNEKITIQYGCKTGILGKALIRIYDAQGRLVATPVNLNLPNAGATLSIDTYSWNGRDANMNLLPPGLYYCHLEVSDRASGKSEKTVQPIVIKSRLK